MGNKDKSLKCRKNKRSSHGNRFTSFLTEQMKALPTSSFSDKLKNDKVGTSLSTKRLKLNLDSQSSGNDSSVDGSVIDINVDLESSEEILILMMTDIHQTFMNEETRRYMSL